METNNVWPLFLCLVAMVKYLLSILLLGCLFYSFVKLGIFCICPSWDQCIANNFFQFIVCPFHFLNGVFLNFNLAFSFMVSEFCFLLKIPLPTPKVWQYTPTWEGEGSLFFNLLFLDQWTTWSDFCVSYRVGITYNFSLYIYSIGITLYWKDNSFSIAVQAPLP